MQIYLCYFNWPRPSLPSITGYSAIHTFFFIDLMFTPYIWGVRTLDFPLNGGCLHRIITRLRKMFVCFQCVCADMTQIYTDYHQDIFYSGTKSQLSSGFVCDSFDENYNWAHEIITENPPLRPESYEKSL